MDGSGTEAEPDSTFGSPEPTSFLHCRVHFPTCDRLMCFFICCRTDELLCVSSFLFSSSSPTASNQCCSFDIEASQAGPPTAGRLHFSICFHAFLKDNKSAAAHAKRCIQQFFFFSQSSFSLEWRGMVCVVKEKHLRVCKRFMDNTSLLWVVSPASCRLWRL